MKGLAQVAHPWRTRNTSVTIHRVDVFQALSDPVRRDILRQLVAGPLRVVDLTAGRGISRPAVSRHLRLLSQSGLVHGEDHGRERHYQLDVQPLTEVQAFLSAVEDGGVRAPVSASALDALETEIRRVSHDRRRQATPITAPGPATRKDTA